MIDNNLTIQAYNASGVPVGGPDLVHAEQISFTTQYPGGIFGTADLFIPRDIVRAWQFAAAQRLVIRNGLKTVFEGYISNLPISIDEVIQGRWIHCIGAWGHVLMNRRIRKPWADTRIDDTVWVWQSSLTAAEKCNVDRNNRIRLTPKSIRDTAGAEVGWTNGQYAGLLYSAPVGETVKRVTFSYNLQMGGQNWILGLDSNGAPLIWSVNATGTGTVDQTLGTPSQTIRLYFYANANQMPATDGTIFGEVSNVVIYTETGAINLTEIAKDVAAIDSRISTDLNLIGSNTLSIVPFQTDAMGGYPTLADILDNAAKYGDSSYNSWAVGVRESDLANDAKPILFVEEFPVLTGYDYAVRLEESNLVPPLDISQDFDDIWNYIIVKYQDANGRDVFLTPTSDAGLTDATSAANPPTGYGQRDYQLDINTTSATVAAAAGKRFLVAHKDFAWRVNGNIAVKGWIRGSGNNTIPACQIRAGKRIKLENWLNDLSGTGLTFLITGTTYNDADQTCQISVGNADPLDAILARLSMGK